MARLAVFHEQTEPLKGFYQRLGKLRSVENETGIAAMSAKIFRALGIEE